MSNASTAFDCCLQSGPEASFHDRETCYLLQCLGMDHCGSLSLLPPMYHSTSFGNKSVSCINSDIRGVVIRGI